MEKEFGSLFLKKKEDTTVYSLNYNERKALPDINTTLEFGNKSLGDRNYSIQITKIKK